MSLQSAYKKLLSSKLFKDSFWAVFGNGLGNVFLLIAGIIIARLLGKDVYGEYGMIKTTMFYLAAFATFGLGTTSTKYIARFKTEESEWLRSVTLSVLSITSVFSGFLCVLLFFFSKPLAEYLNAPNLSVAFEFLGIIVVLRALSLSCAGMLAGFKSFKRLGTNNILAGVIMLAACYPLTKTMGVYGALLALLISQLLICFLNMKTVFGQIRHLKGQVRKSFSKELLSFSFPIALQDLSYTLCHWVFLLILTRYSTYGEVGLYTVASQWNSIVLFIPHLLINVILSYLSSSTSKKEQGNVINKMVLVNFVCSALPFLVVFVFSGIIASFYGSTFSSLAPVMNIYIFSTIFMCVAQVYSSNLISEGKNWRLFFYRMVRDVLAIVVFYIIIRWKEGEKASLFLVSILLAAHVFYFLCLLVDYYIPSLKSWASKTKA
jgi:O-antigen/teichoic acid export membrane protein